ncbi:phage protein, HK97 gp10 family [Ancylobacter novellus DSM 506]|uniref:Phage protein, HK97 gp10 family n=1 Tax=Ancylobacter novellus (strain ATCC 8093 / DSM 506 / JCM 20403 / CCM 1077 / IAM 12100 / NBRC 12443 / NCIMB 10456) TaxID=639283 RepID=D7A0A3_ANCN5|nr:HK97-gp10 family putative phage morphogenesis protein [Ancylobacter novellus]ADH89364.1 phage protein, HK97 gp10 family [Ancylobacter novellus DSM 506]
MADQLTKLQKRFAAIPREVKQAVQPALQRSGEELVATMRQLAPEDTGALKESIVATPAGQSTPVYSQPGGATVVPENAVAVTAGNTDVRYAHLVEYGTAEAPEQPFFWPAVRLTRKRITSRIKRAVSKAVKDAR